MKTRSPIQHKVTKQIGSNLRNLRKIHHLSQHNLGALLGITYQQVQKYESGQNRLPLEKLIFLKSYFNVPYDVFFTGLDLEEPNYTQNPPPYLETCLKISQVRNPPLREKIYSVIDVLCS